MDAEPGRDLGSGPVRVPPSESGHGRRRSAGRASWHLPSRPGPWGLAGLAVVVAGGVLIRLYPGKVWLGPVFLAAVALVCVPLYLEPDTLRRPGRLRHRRRRGDGEGP